MKKKSSKRQQTRSEVKMKEEKKAFCPNCGKDVDFERRQAKEKVNVRGVNVSALVTHCICAECGEEIDVPEVGEENLRLAFDAYKEKVGLLSGEDIKKIREKYDISASALSSLMGLGEKTITRYENGAIQDAVYDTFFKLLKNQNVFSQLLELNKDKIGEEQYHECLAALYDLAISGHSIKLVSIKNPTSVMIDKDSSGSWIMVQGLSLKEESCSKEPTEEPVSFHGFSSFWKKRGYCHG
jgi:putative zinc finger/helix-turn-helix YgiT family protein